MGEDFSAQEELITGICQRLGIDYRGLADAAGIKHETMRKWAKGYQRMPDHIAVLLRHIEQQSVFPGRVEEKENRSPSAAAYELLETETLQKSLLDLSSKLTRCAAHERKYVLSNVRAIMDELDERELKVNSSRPSKGESPSPLVAGQKGKNPGT